MAEVESTILKAMLEAGDTPVSGDRLAKELGVSRVSVWQRLERLREAGFTFEAAPRKGYRLAGTPAALHPALLDAHLRLLRVRPHVTFLPVADSTNSEAERRLALGGETPFAVVAGTQTAGRGRLGRAWSGAHPENLYMSFAFRPFLPPERLAAFTLVMGLRLCERLAAHPGLEELRLKWPNDLVHRGRKIAGMLTESRMDADQVRELVFGLGLNVNGDPADLPSPLHDTAGSLAHAAGRRFDLHRVAAEVIAAGFDIAEEFFEKTSATDPRPLFRKFDALAGRRVTATLRSQPVAGVVEGVDTSGALLLRGPRGLVTPVNAGEVTLRKNPGER